MQSKAIKYIAEAPHLKRARQLAGNHSDVISSRRTATRTVMVFLCRCMLESHSEVRSPDPPSIDEENHDKKIVKTLKLSKAETGIQRCASKPFNMLLS